MDPDRLYIPHPAAMIPHESRYASFAELAAAEREGEAFRITRVEREGAPALAMAIHGGHIEAGTTEVARAIAGPDWSLYLFEGLVPFRSGHLHVTSTRFDEPGCLALVGAAERCVSVHGFREIRYLEIFLGGLDAPWRDALARELQSFDRRLRVHNLGERFQAQDPANIVNRAKRSAGVQLELSSRLRDLLVGDPAALAGFAAVVRESMPR